jgi:hypothetical protein
LFQSHEIPENQTVHPRTIANNVKVRAAIDDTNMTAEKIETCRRNEEINVFSIYEFLYI